jgi:hypothetical protein
VINKSSIEIQLRATSLHWGKSAVSDRTIENPSAETFHRIICYLF